MGDAAVDVLVAVGEMMAVVGGSLALRHIRPTDLHALREFLPPLSPFHSNNGKEVMVNGFGDERDGGRGWASLAQQGCRPAYCHLTTHNPQAMAKEVMVVM